ncbi:non-ribosomal peptide synthetase [Actinoplanes sp. L3-i22]|uniref:non-ribosomal peptide synthetase n=1 Tax=Actinoplanes sp. L3-i22 TaxID=2836373 RepID=UPI001C77D4AA|nr:non-ribosomal peptide synthetase [Actinoplanes sp. L3-i22]BCY09069.1 hypothetical protein L3i22_041570 [Actinoplanes sp. L3-i22]
MSDVATLIGRQAAQRPDTTAVIAGNSRLSYAGLEAASAALAARLAVPPESPIAVCTRRTPNLVVAMLAVLRAGAACVPVDPGYPGERITRMLAGSGCRLALTDADSRERLPAGVETIDVSTPAAPVTGGVAPAAVAADALALILHTSGSTGQPKGVLSTHRNLITMATTEDLLRHRPGDLVAHVLSSSFDAVVLDVFGALINGATVWLGSDQVLRSPGHLLDEVARARPTTLPITSSLMHQIVELRPGQAARPRRVWFGGEAAESAAAVRLLAPGHEVVHHYGPAECTSIATVHLVTAADTQRPVLPIGRAVPGVRLHVLDAGLTPAAAGEVGELYLGGPQVTRGFLGDPRATAERFLPDPFAADGSRMYRTGDLVRTRPDGELAFVGRADEQVKIRGYRVEPAEVAAVIRQVPGVTGVAVVARDDLTPGVRQLVAYVVGAMDRAAIATRVAAVLPDYMAPAAYVSLPALPLLPNRKIDVRALPALPRDRHTGATPGADADVETRLAALWCELLDLRSVAPTDSFFALGGYSLLAARLVARIEETFGTRLPLRTLFGARTLRDLARAVATRITPPAGAAVADAPAEPAAAQRELWFLDRLHPARADYHSPIAVRIHGRLDPALLRRALAELVTRHEVLRWRFPAERGRPRVDVAPAYVPAVEVEQFGTAAPGPVVARLSGLREQPFDLAVGPLLRAHLLRLPDGDDVLLIVVHHIVFDGGSHDIFVRELGELYRAFARGEPGALPAPRHRYAEVLAAEATALGAGELEVQLEHWRRALDGAPPAVALPSGDPEAAEGAAVQTDATIAPAAGTAIRHAALDRGHSPFTLLLTGFALSLRVLCGVDDVVVACPNAGRRGAAAESVIGLFAHLLPIRVRLGDTDRLAGLTAAVGQAVTGAVAHQAVPFDRIVRELKPPRGGRARAPYTQLVLNFVDKPPELPDLGLAATPIRVPIPESRVPLAVIVNADGDGYRVQALTDPREVDPAFAARLLAVLPHALAAVAARPDELVGDTVAALARVIDPALEQS